MTITENVLIAKANIIEVYFMKLMDLERMKGKIKTENTINMQRPFRIILKGFFVKIPSKTFYMLVPNTLKYDLFFFF
jgi:hypothetical protein